MNDPHAGAPRRDPAAPIARAVPLERPAFDDEPQSSGSLFKDYDLLFVAGGCIFGFYLALTALFWLGANGYAPGG